MKIEILRPVMISGEPAAAGSILEVEDSDAVTLMGLGKAVEHQAEDKPLLLRKRLLLACSQKTTTRKRTKES